ncbi:hypothetical protein ACP70R_019697 [Stipagrostis hirtigluma subsp. patula]
MGPAKSSRKTNKITIKRYEDQQQCGNSSSSNKKRKITGLGPKWSKDELTSFYGAYRRYGKKISAAVGKSSVMVKALYNMHRVFLSLPERQATPMGFIALVSVHGNTLDEPPTHRGNGQIGIPSRKAKEHREVPQKKVHETPHPHDSCHEGTIPSFSTSFKKRYYGELARNSQNHTVGNRTPRVPVIVPADRNATDDATPEVKNNSFTKTNNEINNGCANLLINEWSPDGRSGIMEAAKAVQVHTFLEIKGTADAKIYQTQQHLKKRRIEQTMDGGRTIKLEHETMMAVKEGNKPVSLLKQQLIHTEFISADDILILDVLQSLLNATDKMSTVKTNIPPGTLGNNDSALCHRRDEGHSQVDLCNQGKPVGECSASKTRQKRDKKLLHAEVLAKETNIADAIDVTMGSSNSESARVMSDLLESTATFPGGVYPNEPSEIKPEISMSRKTKIKSKSLNGTKFVSCNEGSDNLQARKLLHCLSSESLRRWCTYEWFYSAVDFPWFMNYKFVKYLHHLNLSHLSRLTRSEWSIIRRSLGKPRRFSECYLLEQKEKLEDYRKKVRKYYAQLNDGLLDSLPADLARPFSIGQQIIIRHPNSRELCDGKVLMVYGDCCKVQFDDFGVELVKDTDCMPANWLDNLPGALRSSSLSVRNILETEHIKKVRPSGTWDNTRNGAPISGVAKSLHTASDEQLKAEYNVESERPAKRTTSDDSVQTRGCPNNIVDCNDELESYITAFVQNSQSQARQMVDMVLQAVSGDNDSQDEETGSWNQTTNCMGLESEAATIHESPLPSDLIQNCTTTLLAIKRLADSRHPPANIAGVLERMSSMLRPSCPENLAIYRDIERHISIIKTQLIALVPTPLVSKWN